MTGRRGLIAACLVAAGAVVAVVAFGLEGSRPPAAALGPTPNATQISFVLTLKMNDRALDRDFAAIGDPRSPSFRHRISAAAVGRRYGLPLDVLAETERDLVASGITVVRTYPQRTEIDARASVGTLSRYFRVRFRDYADQAGRRFHAPTARPSIPAALSPWVTGVVGLSTRQVFTAADVRGGSLVPADATIAYDLKPLRDLGIDGSGLTIAVASFQRFSDSDVKAFSQKFALAGPAPQHVVISTGASETTVDEDDLDVEVIHGLAPGARILNYEAPKTSAGLVAMLNRIVSGPATIASDSWGLCDSRIGAAERTAVEHALRAAALRGTTFFVASGDTGAYDCQRSDFADHRLTVDFPGDSPNVVSVGGTVLAAKSDGSYLTEFVWEDPLQNAGGGGGISPVGPAPAWQVTYRIGRGKHRVVPDVSANADLENGWATVIDGESHVVGGTSAAAPFWAASMLLAEQFAQRNGVKRPCFLAPLLYQLAATDQRYPPFHDVVLGANRYYQAGPGWDYATGLGSPDVYNLARDLVARRLAHGGGCNAAG